jgi:tetratricopeptide (TPR) repeat protein
LGVEADRSLNHSQEPTALGYLAMAFAQAEDPDASNEYLNQACQSEPNSEACRMTNVVMNWSSQDWHKVADTFSGFGDEASSHVQIWKLRYLMRQGHYVSALRLIDLLDGQSQVAQFLIPERVKALWRADKIEEAQLVANTALDTLPKEGRKSLSSWMCYEQLSNHCQVNPPRSCRELMKSIPNEGEWELTPTGWLAVTLVKEKCDGLAHPHVYDELMEQTSSNDMREFLAGLDLWAKGKSEAAKEKLAELIKNEDFPDSLRAESLGRIVRWTTKSEELKIWVDHWKNLNSSSKHNLGTALFRALIDRGELAQAVEIGQNILKDSPEEIALTHDVAVAAYRAGDLKAAWRMASQISQGNNSSIRKPASTDEFSRILNELKQRFGATR